MNAQYISVTDRAAFEADAALAKAAPIGEPLKEERLPFSIRLVQTEEELHQAVKIRHAAYNRHIPEFGETLKKPEALDYASDAAVLLATSKLDGAPLGTVRIQTNAIRALNVEQSVQLPGHLIGRRLAEVTRLGVEGAQVGRLVKLGLFKACFEYCKLNQIDWMVATGRNPIDQQYAQLMFEDLYPELGYIPLQHVGNIPHRVMALPVKAACERFTHAGHPMLSFFFQIQHPDIDVEPRPVMESAALRRADEAIAV